MPRGCSISVQSLNWIRLTVPELGWLQFSIDFQLKVPLFTFLGVNGVKFHLSNPQKALPWQERRMVTYCAWGYVQRCDPWAWYRKKGQKLSCVKLAICPDHPRRHKPLEFCMRGRVWEIVIFQVSWKSVEGSRSCGGRKLPSPIDKAHGLYNSLYYRTSRDHNILLLCLYHNINS